MIIKNLETVLEALARGHTAQKKARRGAGVTAADACRSFQGHLVCTACLLITWNL